MSQYTSTLVLSHWQVFYNSYSVFFYSYDFTPSHVFLFKLNLDSSLTSTIIISLPTYAPKRVIFSKCKSGYITTLLKLHEGRVSASVVHYISSS